MELHASVGNGVRDWKQTKEKKAQSRWGGSREERDEKHVVSEHVKKHQAAPSQKDPFSFSKCEQKH
jgi:hypothetical protein